MDSPITHLAIHRLRLIRRVHSPVVAKVKNQPTIRELSAAGFIRPDKLDHCGSPLPNARYIIRTEGKVFLDNWWRDTTALRINMALGILAFLLSLFSILEQAGLINWLP